MSETTLAERPVKSPVPAGNRGLHFSNLAEMWRFCEGVVNSRQFKGIDTPEVALVMLQAGLELGLTPIWSLTNIMVVNGKPAVWGDALLGLVLAHPDCVDVIETMDGDDSASCEVQRKGRLPVKRTFTMADAKKAGLVGKSGPWTQYPKRMLQMRARSWACRDSFADALRGLGVAEELRDTEPKQATARVVERPKLLLPDEPEDFSSGENQNRVKTPSTSEDSAQKNNPASVDDVTTPAENPSGERRNAKGEFEWDAE